MESGREREGFSTFTLYTSRRVNFKTSIFVIKINVNTF